MTNILTAGASVTGALLACALVEGDPLVHIQELGFGMAVGVGIALGISLGFWWERRKNGK